MPCPAPSQGEVGEGQVGSLTSAPSASSEAPYQRPPPDENQLRESGFSGTTSSNKITMMESEEEKGKKRMKKSEQSLRDPWDRSRGSAWALRKAQKKNGEAQKII